MNEADRKEALRLARVFDARTEVACDIIDAATLLARLAAESVSSPPWLTEEEHERWGREQRARLASQNAVPPNVSYTTCPITRSNDEQTT